MFAPVTTCLFVTGKIDKGSIATQAATADSTIEPSALAGPLHANVWATGADLDTPTDSFISDTPPSHQRTGQRYCLANKIWTWAIHRIIPKIRPVAHSRCHRRVP